MHDIEFDNKTVTNTDELSDWELQARLLFTAIVAGKSARFAEKVVRFLFRRNTPPFDTVRTLGPALKRQLQAARSGNYTKLLKCFPQLIQLNPRSCTLEQLESIHGIGPKSARFFLLWTGRPVACAALDVHVLHFLRDLGYKAPKATPPAGATYRRLEQQFLAVATARGVSPNTLDAQVWKAYSSKSKKLVKAVVGKTKSSSRKLQELRTY